MEENRDFPNIWHALLVLGLLLGIQIIAAALLYDFGFTFLRGDPKYSGILMIFSYGLIVVMLMSYKNLTYGELFFPLPPAGSKFNFVLKLVLPIVLATLAIRILVFYIDIFVFIAFPINTEELEVFKLLMGDGIVSFITACLIAPFVEEFLFRGFFLRSFLLNYNKLNALLLSSTLFAVYHFNVHQFPIAFVIGIFSGWLYLITASLWPSIIAHISINSISIFYYNFANSRRDLVENFFSSPALPFTISLLLLLISLKLIKKTIN